VTQSIWTLPAAPAGVVQPMQVSVWSTRCIGVLCTLVVETPMVAPSRRKTTRPGDHSMVAVCQDVYVAPVGKASWLRGSPA
jgi:hypothetical protein